MHIVTAEVRSSSIGLRRAKRWDVLRIAAIVMAIAQGCSSDSGRPKLAPVSGRVVYQGKPVEGAIVSFSAEGSPRVASGKTDSDGRYKLTTFDTNDGAPVGVHAVTIAKLKTTAGPTQEINLDNPGEAYSKQMTTAAAGETVGEHELPAKYANPKESGLQRSVAEKGPNEFNFELD
jgi:hypothetical protein